jgi:hypothetical protein
MKIMINAKCIKLSGTFFSSTLDFHFSRVLNLYLVFNDSFLMPIIGVARW